MATLLPGGSADLDIALTIADGARGAQADPAYFAHTQPICAWAEAYWMTWLPRVSLDQLFKFACDKIGTGATQWAKVDGPAAAFVASARRIGCTPTGPWSPVDPEGMEIDF